MKDSANQKDVEFKSIKAKLLSTIEVNEGLHHNCDAQSEEQQALMTEAQKYSALVLTKLKDTQSQVDLLRKKLSCMDKEKKDLQMKLEDSGNLFACAKASIFFFSSSSFSVLNFFMLT